MCLPALKPIVDQITKAFGHSVETYPIEYLEGTLKDQFGIYGDSSALQRDLDWKPSVSIPEGISLMAAHAKKFYK